MDRFLGHADRRRAPRQSPHAADPLARVRLRTGRELQVLEISSTGALLEGEPRLLPGTHVDVHVITVHGRLLVRSRVVRAFVCQLTSESVRYRGAIAFERKVELGSGSTGSSPTIPTDTPFTGDRSVAAASMTAA